jgi:hypothetical protein
VEVLARWVAPAGRRRSGIILLLSCLFYLFFFPGKNTDKEAQQERNRTGELSLIYYSGYFCNKTFELISRRTKKTKDFWFTGPWD